MAEKKRRYTQQDFVFMAEYVRDEYDRRKGKRKHFDKVMKEIDRQLAMEPDIRHKLTRGQRDPRKAWMPEVELPLQAETLEQLMADALEMQFPDTGPWYQAHSETPQELLRRLEGENIITGEENDQPSLMTQDNVDKLVVGIGNHWRRQYDFIGNMDLINGEAFKYSMGIGRARPVKKSVYMDTARGIVRRDQKIPVLIPKTLKQTYLDDREHILMQEGFALGPVEIFTKRMALDDVMRQAKNGKNQGWIVRQLGKVQPDKDGMVDVFEAEGDVLIPRSRENIFIPNVILWVVHGKNNPTVVRITFRELPYTSVIRFPYHREHIDSPYASSPLNKGMPLQAAATEALMRTSEAAALANGPPVGWDRNDLYFAERGGPEIRPYAKWGTIGEVTVHHQIGRPAEMAQLYGIHTQNYYNVTGVNPPRLGAQTLSHTTAFAKNAELQRGASRTVKYVRRTLRGPLVQFLGLEYELGLKNMGRAETTFYIDAYGGFVTVRKDLLPEKVVFEAHGAAGPLEEQARLERRFAALDRALNIDLTAQQRGQPPRLDVDALIQQTLRDGGWTDIDPLLASPAAPQSAPPQNVTPLLGQGGPI